MSGNVIIDDKWAPPRRPRIDRLEAVLKRFNLIEGGGAHDGKLPTDKGICIMEACAYILGYDGEEGDRVGVGITDRPPCTSKIIQDAMIGLNDSWDNQAQRNKLKKLIPYIINTAPTRWEKVPQRLLRKGGPPERLVQDVADKRYKAAEEERKRILDALKPKKSKWGDMAYSEDALPYMTFPAVEKIIKQLADVARFGSADPFVVFPAQEDSSGDRSSSDSSNDDIKQDLTADSSTTPEGASSGDSNSGSAGEEAEASPAQEG
jgi:hypothetical protein